MKEAAEKYLPYLLILTGGVRVLRELFPQRLGFMPLPGGSHYGWVFWMLGVSGLLWLILKIFPDTNAAHCESGSADRGLKRFFRNYWIEMTILLLTAASLAMLIRSGWFWDDAVNSTAYLAEKKDNIPLFRHVLDFMGEYLKLGRVNVLSFYYYFFFYIENVSVYKALIILLILGDMLIFRKVLPEFGVSLSGSRMGMLLLPLMFQTRAYQDPVSGFYGLMQILTAEMLLCAFFLSRWLRTEKRRELIFSLLFFAVGLLTYEVCFPFLLMICLLIWIRRRNFLRAVKDSLPFVFLVILIMILIFVIRSTSVKQIEYPGVAFSFDPWRIMWAATRQITAGLPLSYYSAGYQASVMEKAYPASEFMNYDFVSFLRAVRLSDLMILFAVMVVLTRIRGFSGSDPQTYQQDPAKKVPGSELAVLGLSFAVLPIITVALSERYQWQLMPGLGYLPVYMQYYGIAMLLLFLTLRWNGSTGIRALCLSMYTIILLLNLQNNRAVTEIMNRAFYHSRNAGETALHGGILDFLPEDSLLIADNDRTYIWESDWLNRGLYQEFYGNNSRRLSAIVGDNKLLRDAVDQALADGAVTDTEGWLMVQPDDLWLISYSGGSERGLARLGRLRSAAVHTDTLEIRNAKTDRVLYFISGAYPEQAAVRYTAADGIFRQPDIKEQHRVRQTADGILYELPEEELLWFHSLFVDN